MNRPNDVLTRPAVGNHPVRHAQVEANGASFHVVEQGQGPAVLFLHGFPDTVATWPSQMQAVSENGYRAVALARDGHLALKGITGPGAPPPWQLDRSRRRLPSPGSRIPHGLP